MAQSNNGTKPLWKQMRFALPVVIVICLAAFLFGAHRSIAQQRAAVTAAFLNGTEGDGYSIADRLTDRAEYARQLTIVCEAYDALAEPAEALAEAADALLDAVKTGEAETAADANTALTAAAERLDQAMCDAPLDEKAERYRSELTAELTDCNDKISHLTADYNALAETFNTKTLHAFPLGTAARLTGVREAERYTG